MVNLVVGKKYNTGLVKDGVTIIAKTYDGFFIGEAIIGVTGSAIYKFDDIGKFVVDGKRYSSSVYDITGEVYKFKTVYINIYYDNYLIKCVAGTKMYLTEAQALLDKNNNWLKSVKVDVPA